MQPANQQQCISSTTDKEVESFEIANWKSEDIAHYGREIHWDKRKPDFFTFKAEKDAVVVGVIGGNHIAGVLFIERIIVKDTVHNQGIGKLLLHKVEEYAKEIGAHKIYLSTGKEWGANEFYKTYGYEKKGELTKHFYKVDFVIYSKLLI